MIFLRAITILYTCCKYRLDNLLPKPLPLIPRLLCALLPNPIKHRGRQLRLACERLGPVFIKFGQLLSTRPDLLPADIVAELSHLQDNVPPFATDRFRQIVALELGGTIDHLFTSLERQPLASASVAQVHAATLKDGRDVVVKVIRPGIRKTIDQDTRLLLWNARQLEKWLKGGARFKPVAVIKNYRDPIFNELDLQREAANASQLRRNFADSPLLYVPEIHWDYCSRQVLVMERIYGIPVTDVKALAAQHTDMKSLAERGVTIFFTQVFEHNFFHADMHPGNIFVSRKHPREPQYIAVDMAIVGSLEREDQYYLARNLLAIFRRDYRSVAELHVQSGWIPKDTTISEFAAAVRTVCEPIFEKPLGDISFGKIMITLFATAQGFQMEVQPQLVLLQKTLLHVEGLGRQLYPELDLWQTAHPFLENWLKDRMSPKNLLQELRHFRPEWLETLPEVPMKIMHNLEMLEDFKALSPVLKHAADDYYQRQRKRRKRRYQNLAAGLLATGAVVTAWPEVTAQLTGAAPLSVGLALAAVALLFFR